MSDSTTSCGSERQAVSLETLARLREQTFDGETDLVPELIEVFLNEVPSGCLELGELVARGDASAVRARAHHMRSSTSNLGATRMTDLCNDLESIARQGQLQGADDLVRQLQHELSEVKAAFASYLSDRG